MSMTFFSQVLAGIVPKPDGLSSLSATIGGRVNELYGEGSAQSVLSRGTLRVPRSNSRGMSVLTAATRRFLSTSNRRPRNGWKGWEISTHTKGEL